MSTASPATGGVTKPTVGRDVHVYRTIGAGPRKGEVEGPVAAKVTGVANGGNAVFATLFPMQRLPEASVNSINHKSVATAQGEAYWEWPPRV